MTWFLDSLKLDLEVLSRSLAQPRAQRRRRPPPRRTKPHGVDPDDLAA